MTRSVNGFASGDSIRGIERLRGIRLLIMCDVEREVHLRVRLLHRIVVLLSGRITTR